jgi:hypothetical protein
MENKDVNMRLLSPFVDLRLKKSGELFFKRMIERKTVVIKRLVNGAAEKKRFERWIRHEDVTPARLINTEKSRLEKLVEGRHILGIQDTTEINYQSHDSRAHGLGTVGNGKDIGFFLHPMIAVDASTGGIIGCAEVAMWNRTKKADENYPELPIEEKESYRWIKTADEAQKSLSKADCITFIGDRENDIYEFFDRIPNQNTHVITRVCRDRVIKNAPHKKLYAHLAHTEESGRVQIEIPRDIRKGCKKREAVLSIKHSMVDIVRPKKCTDKSASKSIKIYVVEAKEVDCPGGQEPVHWRIFTTHIVNNFDEAKQIILWYRMRWTIEQVFRTIKSQGLNIEESQIESGSNLMKLAVLALCAAIRIMQLISGRDGTTELKTNDTFTTNEQLFLAALLAKVEGKTQKQQNPYLKDNIAWASWIIARLGGWHCYTKSEGPPGPIVMGRGLKRFHEMFDGWNLYRDLSTG